MVDKEGYAIVATLRRLEYLFWSGVKIFCDYRNLAYTFSPGSCRTTVTKAATQRLEHWRTFLSQYLIEIVHISGEHNCWGDLLSRWRTLTPETPEAPVPVKTAAVFAMPKADYSLPTKDVIKARQMVLMPGKGTKMTPLGPALRGKDGVYRMRRKGDAVFWVPGEARKLQVRLMTCAHMKEAGHRGAGATLERLKEYCVWPEMEADVK